MKRKKEESFVLDDMEKIFKRHNKYDYQMFYDCQKHCCDYGSEQLLHAKAILEKRLTKLDYIINLINFFIAVIALGFTTYSIIISMIALQNSNVYTVNDQRYEVVALQYESGGGYNVEINKHENEQEKNQREKYAKQLQNIGVSVYILIALIIAIFLCIIMFFWVEYPKDKYSYLHSIVCYILENLDEKNTATVINCIDVYSSKRKKRGKRF